MNPQIITLKEAVARFGASQRKVYAELRARKILGSQNVALPAYVKGGYFQIKHDSYFRGNVEHQYAVTMVTPLGYSLLQEIIDAMGAEKPVLPAERQGLSGEHGLGGENPALHCVETNTEGTTAPPITRYAQQ